MIFASLRNTPWEPAFEWLTDVGQVADQINSYHEDYPKYVAGIVVAIQRGVTNSNPNHAFLRSCHRTIFGGTKQYRYRRVNVRVGLHRPPSHASVGSLMAELQDTYSVPFQGKDIFTLEEWYKDFETVHPFVDGNGRVGGVVVALYSHLWFPEKGYYTVKQ